MKPQFDEEAIRPADLMRDKQACIEADRAMLLSRKAEFVVVNCPACQCSDAAPFGSKDGLAYVWCRACETVYTNPRPSERVLRDFYASSKNYAYWNRHIFPATEPVRRGRIFRPRAKRTANYCRRFGVHTGTLLEIGCAFGTFLDEIRTMNLFAEIIGVEPTPDLAATTRARGFDVIEKPVEQLQNAEHADVIVAFEVIEHLFCPQSFVRQCRSLLNTGGMLLLTCPNVKGFDIQELRLLSGTFDHEHLNYFHPASLAGLLKRTGFEILHSETPGRLDADLVRKAALTGQIDLSDRVFLHRVLVEEWDQHGQRFQDFLAEQGMSSHLWLAARRAD